MTANILYYNKLYTLDLLNPDIINNRKILLKGENMEITTILGVIIGVIAVVGAMIFKHINFAVLLNPAAFFVIVVGTIATILNSFPGENVKVIGSLFNFQCKPR